MTGRSNGKCRAIWVGRMMAVLTASVLVAGTEIHGSGQTQAAAPARTQLPDVPLQTAGGVASSTKALPAQGRWLLVHLQANCAPCDTLLTRIQADAPVVAPRLVIVVSGVSAADLARVAASHGALESAAWFADEGGALGAALQIQEAPLLMAMNDRSIQWTLAGVLSGSTRLRDVLTGWVATPGARR